MFAFDHYQIRDHELHHIRKNVALTKSLSYSLMEGKQLFFCLAKALLKCQTTLMTKTDLVTFSLIF